MRDIVRASVIYGWSEYTQKGAEHKGRSWELTCLAIDRISAYKMVEDGVFTYQELGVQAFRGVLPFWIVREHNIIRNIFAQARKEKAQNG